MKLLKSIVPLVCALSFALTFAACGGDEDTSGSGGASLACPGGSAASLDDMPNCKAYSDKMKGCCPKSQARVDQAMQSMACVGDAAAADQACKAALPQASQACDAMKLSPGC